MEGGRAAWALFLCFALCILLGEGYLIGRTTNETLVGASTTVSFEPFVPNVLMTFKDANRNVVPGVNATFNWISFDEVDNSTGTAVADSGKVKYVQTLNISDPSLVWQEAVGGGVDSYGHSYKNINYTTTFANGCQATIIYYHFPQWHFIEYPYLNASRNLTADSFKFSLWISGWKPVNISNLFLMRLNTAAAPYFSGVTYVDNDFFFTVTVNIGNSSVIQTFNIISAAVVDGKARDLSWYGEFNGIQYVPLEIFGYREFYYFPNFNESLFYDPDLSALVPNQGNLGVSSGDGGTSSTTTIVVAVLVPVFVVIAVVVIVIALIVAFLVVKQRRRVFHKRLEHVDTESTKSVVPN